MGGDVKITVKFLKEEWTAADTGINRGAIEIPRRVIRADILKEFDKRKYWLISSISIRYICLRVDTLYLLMFILLGCNLQCWEGKKSPEKEEIFVSHTHVLKRRRSWQKWRLLWSTNTHCWSHSCRSWRYVYMHLKRNNVWQVFHHHTDSSARPRIDPLLINSWELWIELVPIWRDQKYWETSDLWGEALWQPNLRVNLWARFIIHCVL